MIILCIYKASKGTREVKDLNAHTKCFLILLLDSLEFGKNKCPKSRKLKLMSAL